MASKASTSTSIMKTARFMTNSNELPMLESRKRGDAKSLRARTASTKVLVDDEDEEEDDRGDPNEEVGEEWEDSEVKDLSEEEEEEEEEEEFSSVYLKAIQAYENIALKKDQRKIEKSLKDARSHIDATLRTVEEKISTELKKQESAFTRASEDENKTVQDSSNISSERWAKVFTLQSAHAGRVTESIELALSDMDENDRKLFQEIEEALKERSVLGKKSYGKFKKTIGHHEQESIEMAKAFEKGAKTQVRFLKGACKA